MRIYEFAKELGKDSAELIHELRSEFGFEIKSHLSGISEEQMEQVRTAWNQKLLSSLTDLRDDLEKQVDDSHKQALKEVFNVDKKEPEFISYDLLKDDKETKKMEELVKKDEQSMIKTAEHARKEYAKTVHNITENPDDWHVVIPKEDASSLVLEDVSEEKQQEIIIEKPSWCYRILGWLLGN